MTKTEQLRLEREQRKLEKLQKERERLEAMRSFEHQYEGYGAVCGIDEVGRGPLGRSGGGRSGDSADGL